MSEQKKSRVLVFVVAYNAERTLENVLCRIPASLAEAVISSSGKISLCGDL